MKRVIISAAAAAALLPAALLADFISNGDPVAAAVVGSCAAASGGTSLETATCRASNATSVSLEARYRTFDESDGTKLRSDACRGIVLIVF